MIDFDKAVTTLKSWDIDDFIEQDSIAEMIYDHFIAINGQQRGLEFNQYIVKAFQVARIILAKAYDTKHPETVFKNEYITIVDGFYRYGGGYDRDAYKILSVTLQMCISLPRNLDRLLECTNHHLSCYRSDSSYDYSFENLVAEMKGKGYFYHVEKLVDFCDSVVDITAKDWGKITNDFNQADIEKQVLNNPSLTPSQQKNVLQAIKARYNMSTSDGAIALDLRDMKKFFAGLEQMVDMRIKEEVEKSKQERKETDNLKPLKEEIKSLKEENTKLQHDIAVKDADIEDRNGAIAMLEQRVIELSEDIKRLESEKGESVDSEEDEKDDPGHRTRKVVSAALLEIFKLAMNNTGNKQHTFIDTAKLISYLTGFSHNTIRNEISYGYTFNNWQAKEIEKVNELLKNVGINVKLKYDNE